ncbi:hypothetical protein SESBI_42858 [Sesbania bispinosa]|nr:hypothetical protein SESBI_42858 [Sesbania bispinosa]
MDRNGIAEREGMALLGCDVYSDKPKGESFGSIKVLELQWGDKSHIKAVNPPFDYIIGTDVWSLMLLFVLLYSVEGYVEHLLEPLLQTILSLSEPRTTILLGYEIRSTCVHEKMLQMWKKNFDVKTVSKSKMDETFQHASIQLFIMGFKHSAECTGNSGQATAEKIDVETGVEDKGTEENVAVEGSSPVEENVEDHNHSKPIPQNAKLSEWEARRYGAMAARILRDGTCTCGESESEPPLLMRGPHP